MAGISKNTLHVSVISAEPQAAENVIHMLKTSGIATDRFDSASDWMKQSHLGAPTSKAVSLNGNGGECVLLVGDVDSLVKDAATAEIQAKMPGFPVVVVAPDMNVDKAVAVMRQGATDVVPLPCRQERLEAAVINASEAGRQSRHEMSRRQALRGRLEALTRAERQVLDAMLTGMANKQIAQTLQIGLRTVELRRSKIMRKMEAKSLAELVRLVCEADPTSIGIHAAPVEA